MKPACDAEEPTWQERVNLRHWHEKLAKMQENNESIKTPPPERVNEYKRNDNFHVQQLNANKTNADKQIMNIASEQSINTAKSLLSPERTYVAGVTYSDYQRVKQFKIGTELGLVWERSNAVDKKAIAVYYKGIRIGYIPAPKSKHTGEIEYGIQARMHNLRECGYKTKAILTSYRPNAAKAWEIFTIEVQFTDPNKVATKGEPIDVKF